MYRYKYQTGYREGGHGEWGKTLFQVVGVKVQFSRKLKSEEDRESSLAVENSTSGSQESSLAEYPFQWMRYC